MRYVLALLLPPLAVLLCGKPIQFVVSLIMTVVILLLCFVGFGLFICWVPAVHAFMLVHNHMADKRTGRVVKAIEGSKK